MKMTIKAKLIMIAIVSCLTVSILGGYGQYALYKTQLLNDEFLNIAELKNITGSIIINSVQNENNVLKTQTDITANISKLKTYVDQNILTADDIKPLEDKNLYLSQENAPQILKIMIALHAKAESAYTAQKDTVRLYIKTSERNLLIANIVSLLQIITNLSLVIRSIVKPLRRSTEIIGELAKGNYLVDISDHTRPDEIGTMAKAQVVLKQAVEKNSDYVAQISAISQSLAVAAFKMDGTLFEANNAFLASLDFNMDDIKDQHHRILAGAKGSSDPAYLQFWHDLNAGKAQIGEFKMFGKNGKEVYFQASYNPIMDIKGAPFKVMLYATDVTEQVLSKIENEKGAEEAMQVLSQLSAGNLSSKMTHDYKGTYKQIRQELNNTVEQLYTSMTEIKTVIGALAYGDLTKKVNGQYEGVFDEIKESVNNTIEKLKNTINEMKTAAAAVASSAGEISSASGDLSHRTETQASTLEETAASIEEINSAAKSNSKNAQDASDLAKHSRSLAEEGGTTATHVVSAMDKISASSKKVSEIITVIDEIAFQTNLLALNAAVEAARAGDAGKGFAVVASEVRSLAGRASQASKEIRDLINQSSAQVEEGSNLAHQAGEKLTLIVDSFTKVATLITDIKTSGEEQARGIDEVNVAVSQLDSATQQNAAMVEQTTASARTLSELAQNLNGLVGFFKLEESKVAEFKPYFEEKKVVNS